MKAVLIPEAARATVELRDDNGKRIGVHVFKTLDEALEWLTAMKWDYEIAA